MTSEPFLRVATSADVPALAELDRLCFGGEAWSADLLAGSLSLPTTQGWVWEEAGRLIGFILVQQVGTEAEILTIGIAPDRQKQGLARHLLDHALKHLGAGVTVFLEVADDNLAAQKLYEQAGFACFGRRKAYYPRPCGAIDALTYQIITKG